MPWGTLTTVTAPGEADLALTFDAFERKVTDGGTSSNILFDCTTHYVRNPGGVLLASVDGANEEGRWLITDQHTDVIAGFSLDGAELVGSRAFDPFGRSLAEDGTNPAVGYQSGWTDPESGDVNMAARWYQPGTGAFASRDTSLLDPTPSVHANRYTYGAGSPLMYVDPDGHAAVCATVVTAPACAGGAAGSFFGPWGTAIGAGAGLAVGGVLAWNKYMGGVFLLLFQWVGERLRKQQLGLGQGDASAGAEAGGCRPGRCLGGRAQLLVAKPGQRIALFDDPYRWSFLLHRWVWDQRALFSLSAGRPSGLRVRCSRRWRKPEVFTGCPLPPAAEPEPRPQPRPGPRPPRPPARLRSRCR